MAEEAKKNVGFYEHTFRKPVEYNGETIEKLSFDFDKLTGADAQNIDDELQALGKVALVPSVSGVYLIRMAAKACTSNVGADIFDIMSMADYNRIKTAARNFLMSAE